MDVSNVEFQVHELLEPIVAAQGAIVDQVCYRAQHVPPALIVTVDGTAGTDPLSLDEIAALTTVISEALDGVDLLDSQYTLEVSTRGAESKLTQPRHFQRNIGRVVEVKFKNGNDIRGILESATETGFNVVTDGESRYVEYGETKRVRPRVQFG